jgi:hypothetical protein
MTTDDVCHRTNVLVSEVKRNIIAETLAGARGGKVDYLTRAEMESMFTQGDKVVYPKAVKRGKA